MMNSLKYVPVAFLSKRAWRRKRHQRRRLLPSPLACPPGCWMYMGHDEPVEVRPGVFEVSYNFEYQGLTVGVDPPGREFGTTMKFTRGTDCG